MTTAFEKLYKLAEGQSSNEEMYMPQPFGQDPEHQSTMDPVNPEPLGITEPKEDGNQFTGSKESDENYLDKHLERFHGGYSLDEFSNPFDAHDYYHSGDSGINEDRHFHGKDGHAYRAIKIVESSTKTADMSNTDENPSPGNVSAPKSVYNIDVEDPPEQQLFGDAGETSRGDGSIKMTGSTINLEARKIIHAYILENGSPQCSVCEKVYTPKTISEAKLAHCGHCPEDNPDANKIDEGDVIDGDVIKTSSKKLSNDSELYTRGYLDHLHGKPLDEDLAVLSDDYFNGYDQARYYGKTPLESVGAKPHKVTQPAFSDNSLEGWDQIGGQDYKYDIDRSKIIASTLPTNVLEAFFNTEE